MCPPFSKLLSMLYWPSELGRHRFHAVSMSTPQFSKISVSTSMYTPRFLKKSRVHVHATVLKKSRPLQGLKKSCPCPHQDFLWVRFKVDGPKGVTRDWTVHRKVGGLEPNWTVFWARVNGQGSKWTVIRLKVNGPDESKDKSGRYKNVKVDGPSILKIESGRLKNFKVDGLKVWK